jgi:hypothetical protein
MNTNAIRTSKEIGGKCYACDAAAVGARDCRPEGGDVEPACARHAERRPVIVVCMYCDTPTITGRRSAWTATPRMRSATRRIAATSA